jgi:hypothetical protein
MANTNTSPNTRLHGGWLLVARLAWLTGFMVLAAMYLFGFLAVREVLSTVCEDEPCTLRQQIRRTAAGEQTLGWPGPPIGYAAPLRPDQVEALETLGLSLDGYGWLGAIQMGIPTLVYLLIAAGLFWQKSDDWMVLFVSFMVATFPLQDMPLPFTLVVRQPAWEWVFVPASSVALSCFLIFPLVFPTGRFVPRWTRWMALYVMAGATITILFRNTIMDTPRARNLLVGVYLLVSFSTGVYAQLFRYFRVASPAERQQLKWVIVGLAGFASTTFAVVIPLDSLLASPAMSADPARALVLSVIPDTLFRATSLFIPLSITISVLRYRLWDIDIIIRRTLIFGLLTGTLALVYFSSVVLLGQVFQTMTGQQSPFTIVLSTLAIAAIFSPLRRRIQDIIDRRFYRRKYDAEKTLANFSTVSRDQIDLDGLTTLLLRTVQETMQPEHLSLWLAEQTSNRLSGKTYLKRSGGHRIHPGPEMRPEKQSESYSG